MADPTPIAAAVKAYVDRTQHYDVRAYPVIMEEGLRGALTAALDAVDVARVLIDHTRINGIHGDCSCGHVAPLGRSFTAHQEHAIRAALLAAPECPICGSTTPGSTPSCDCDAHRNVPSTEAGEADPGLLLILLGGILGALLLAGVLAVAGVLG